MNRIIEFRTGKRRVMGYSIMEIVVTAAIIGILTLILTPVISNRSRTAKIRAAERDIEHLADAQSRAAIDTGWFYRLNVLDDVSGGDGLPNNDPLNDTIDGLADEQLNTLLAVPESIFIDTQTLDLSPLAITLYTNLLLNETGFGWNGPYINWHRDNNANDWPDDPWGNDYLLMMPIGGMGAGETTFSQLFPAFPLAPVNNRTDRPAILSLGPNGIPGDDNISWGTGDDIFRKFF